MKLYDEYKDDRIDRESYKQKAEKIGRQLEEIRRKIAESERDAKMLEQDNTAEGNKTGRISEHGEIRYREITGSHQGYPVHSQEEIEIE